MKTNDKGVTLVELIIAVSISVIVLALLASLIWQSANYYRRSNEEINLQMEAQTILNQIKDLIVEADNVKFDQASDPSILRIQQGADNLYEIYFNYSDKELTFIKVQREADGSISRTTPQLFGRFVEDFQVIDTDDSTNIIKISFTLQGSYSTYKVEESRVNLRNQIKPMQSYW